VLTGVAGMGSAMTETTRRMSYDRERESYFPYLGSFHFPKSPIEKEAVSQFDFSILRHFSQDAL